jgi:hypothetical protein
MLFLSFRGELSRQYKINKMQIEDRALMPAAFSLSVFNAPPALASMALGLKGGYTALYPGSNAFSAGLNAAKAILTGPTEELIFVYADEEIPEEYAGLLSDNPPPLAFGLLLTKAACSGSISLSSLNKDEDHPEDRPLDHPLNFLKALFLCKENHASP